MGEKKIRSTERAVSLGGRKDVELSGSGAVLQRRGGVVGPLSLGSALEPTLSQFDPRLKPPLHSALLSLFDPGGQRVQQCRRELVMVCLRYRILQHSATFHIQQRSSRYTSTDDVPYSGA
jgi:hypothetical protein